MSDLRHIVESLLFVSKEPLSVDRIRTVLELDDAGPVREALDRLAAEYEARGGGFFLREVAGGYQIRTRPEYAEWIKKLLQPGSGRLSKAAMETLAIIAYKQPVIRSDIEHIRGVDSGGVIRMLLERKLIRVLGRKEIPGRPLIYATTKLFLQVFDLRDLKDLPSPKEIEAMSAEARSAEAPENNDEIDSVEADADDEGAVLRDEAPEPEEETGEDATPPLGPDTGETGGSEDEKAIKDEEI